KGGFYPKQLPPTSNRDAWLAEGTESYRVFIRALLSVTDNLVNDEVAHPEAVVIHDGDDPYFVAKGELIAIFDADFVPKPDFLRKLVHYFTDPIVGCAQMRWSHINGSYNLLTRLQTIMLDGHFVVEQTTRNRTGNFFNFNGTAGIWRRE